MTRSLLPLSWYRAFEASARHKSFTVAAEELNITQSAVSQQIKAMEARVGRELFLRLPRGLSLTQEGRRLLPNISDALQRLERLSDSFDPAPRTRDVTVKASVSVLDLLIIPNLQDFTDSHPDLRIRMLSRVWSDDFNRDEADIQVRFGPIAVAGRDARLLGPHDRVIVCAPAVYPARPEDVFQGPLVQTAGVTDTWQDEYRLWTSKGMALPPLGDRQTSCDNFSAAVRLAQLGMGAAILPRVIAQPILRTGEIVEIRAPRRNMREGLFLSCHADRSSPAFEFAEWLVGIADGNAAP